jgi:predicted Fe-Mo cluster-binding NifX family protein
MFLVVDTSRLDLRRIPNREPDQPGARCDPFRALGEEPVDSFIVGGIGARALQGIARRNLPVYGTALRNVADALAAFTAGRLALLREGGPGLQVV